MSSFDTNRPVTFFPAPTPDTRCSPFTYKSRKVVVDALRRQPLAQLPLFPHQLVFQLGDILSRGGFVVTFDGGLRGLFELPTRANEQLLVHLLRWHHMTWWVGNDNERLN